MMWQVGKGVVADSDEDDNAWMGISRDKKGVLVMTVGYNDQFWEWTFSEDDAYLLVGVVQG